mgnify:CR=1 FL=1
MAEAAQEAGEAVLGAAEIIHGIDTGTAEIADGFVGLVGHVDGGEFTGTQETDEFDGIFFVGFDVVASLGGDGTFKKGATVKSVGSIPTNTECWTRCL